MLPLARLPCGPSALAGRRSVHGDLPRRRRAAGARQPSRGSSIRPRPPVHRWPRRRHRTGRGRNTKNSPGTTTVASHFRLWNTDRLQPGRADRTQRRPGSTHHEPHRHHPGTSVGAARRAGGILGFAAPGAPPTGSCFVETPALPRPAGWTSTALGKAGGSANSPDSTARPPLGHVGVVVSNSGAVRRWSRVGSSWKVGGEEAGGGPPGLGSWRFARTSTLAALVGQSGRWMPCATLDRDHGFVRRFWPGDQRLLDGASSGASRSVRRHRLAVWRTSSSPSATGARGSSWPSCRTFVRRWPRQRRRRRCCLLGVLAAGGWRPSPPCLGCGWRWPVAVRVAPRRATTSSPACAMSSAWACVPRRWCWWTPARCSAWRRLRRRHRLLADALVGVGGADRRRPGRCLARARSPARLRTAIASCPPGSPWSIRWSLAEFILFAQPHAVGSGRRPVDPDPSRIADVEGQGLILQGGARLGGSSCATDGPTEVGHPAGPPSWTGLTAVGWANWMKARPGWVDPGRPQRWFSHRRDRPSFPCCRPAKGIRHGPRSAVETACPACWAAP